MKYKDPRLCIIYKVFIKTTIINISLLDPIVKKGKNGQEKIQCLLVL